MLRFSTEKAGLRLNTKSPYIYTILKKIASMNFVENEYSILMNGFINSVNEINLKASNL